MKKKSVKKKNSVKEAGEKSPASPSSHKEVYKQWLQDEITKDHKKEKGASTFNEKQVTSKLLDTFDDCVDYEQDNIYPTGLLGLDYHCLGIGGICGGRIYEFSGEASTGKSLLAQKVSKKVIERGGRVVYFDGERSFSKEFASKYVDIPTSDRFQIIHAGDGAEALKILELTVEQSMADLCVVDSVASLLSKNEKAKDSSYTHMSQLARLMSLHMKKIVRPAFDNNIALIYTNQLRSGISLSSFVKAEAADKTTGGRALPFYAHVRLFLQKIRTLSTFDNKTKDVFGQTTKVTASKNKLFKPMNVSLFEYLYEEGIKMEKHNLSVAMDLGVVDSSGWPSYGGKKYQGLDKMAAAMKREPEIMKNIINECVEKIKELRELK